MSHAARARTAGSNAARSAIRSRIPRFWSGASRYSLAADVSANRASTEPTTMRIMTSAPRGDVDSGSGSGSDWGLGADGDADVDADADVDSAHSPRRFPRWPESPRGGQ